MTIDLTEGDLWSIIIEDILIFQSILEQSSKNLSARIQELSNTSLQMNLDGLHENKYCADKAMEAFEWEIKALCENYRKKVLKGFDEMEKHII